MHAVGLGAGLQPLLLTHGVHPGDESLRDEVGCETLFLL